jgi:prolyl-tRNA editing enzyme YbaK/EbsC (Cys-tRNA(Pro) deacylase)
MEANVCYNAQLPPCKSENSMTLKPSAKKIQDMLTEIGTPFQVVELSASTRTAQEAATALGCEMAQIVKSLVFVNKISNQPILLLVSGINRVNEKAIENGNRSQDN